MEFRELGVDLEQEDGFSGFQGVTLDKDLKTEIIEMKQNGLIKRVIGVVRLYYGTSKCKITPSEAMPLVKDENGEPASWIFRYISVVGMLLYMSAHTQPNVALAVNICDR